MAGGLPQRRPAAARRRSRGGRRVLAEPNVTPMVDVALVLLIVFMVAAPLLATGVPLELPETEAEPLPQEEREPFTVQIGPDGRVFVLDVPVPEGGLAERLAAVARERREDRVYLRADAGIDYGRVMRVMAALQRGGFRSIALVTEPEGTGGAREVEVAPGAGEAAGGPGEGAAE